jgi:hypothetical protein
MAIHKYKAGQKVTLAPNKYGVDRQDEPFEIVRALPEEHGVYQYRLKSIVDGHERVAMEAELAMFG